MTATTAQVLTGLAVAASYRFSQDRAVPGGGLRPGVGRGERDAVECGAPSAPQDLVGAVSPDAAPTRLHGAHRG